MSRKKLLICGATGFIGRNVLESYLQTEQFDLVAVYHDQEPPITLLNNSKIKWLHADLTQAGKVAKVLAGVDIVIQAAATTSGAKEIVNKPYYHVTDNALMNSLIFRQCFEQKIEQVIFFSCTTMYKSSQIPVKEEDFDGEIIDKYFGVGWTKVYIEKMCEFYSRLGSTKYAVLRHSNIYGPYDKFDLERSHVFGATVAKVMQAKDRVIVWGDGSDERDLLHVRDLVDCIDLFVQKQETPFELFNVGLGRSISVRELVEKVRSYSGRDIEIEYDSSKPSIGFKLWLNISKITEQYGWKPKILLDEGVQMTLEWYKQNYMSEASRN